MPFCDQPPDQRGKLRVSVEPTGEKERARNLLPLQHGKNMLAPISILITGEDQADVLLCGIPPDNGTVEVLAMCTTARFTTFTPRRLLSG
jgi:hypothetical protein